MAAAETAYHDGDCYWYWPCGCRKERQGGRAVPHTHVTEYAEPAPRRNVFNPRAVKAAGGRIQRDDDDDEF